MPADALGERLGVREPILLRSVLHDREIEVALTMARIEPLSTQPGPRTDMARCPLFGRYGRESRYIADMVERPSLTHQGHRPRCYDALHFDFKRIV